MALPWTMPDPERGSAAGRYDCPTCVESVPEAVREAMHCGFLPRASWREPMLPVVLGPGPYDCDTCPGYVVRLPALRDAAEAYEAIEAGIPEHGNPLRLRVLNQAAMAMRRSFKVYEAERARAANRRVEAMR